VRFEAWQPEQSQPDGAKERRVHSASQANEAGLSPDVISPAKYLC